MYENLGGDYSPVPPPPGSALDSIARAPVESMSLFRLRLEENDADSIIYCTIDFKDQSQHVRISVSSK